jgi:DNA transposition AAA+ family ATPase
MKEKFVVTKNIKKFLSAMQHIKHKLHGVERIAVLAGEVGLGKTVAGLYFGVSEGATMLTIWPAMSAHCLLRELAKELGVEPVAWRTENLIEQIKKILIEEPRTIILDEIDHFFRDNGDKGLDALETLRKIHDVCHCPMVFIGEEQIDKKIARIPRLNDRIVEIVRFERYRESDIKDIVAQLSEYRFEDDAIEKITKVSAGRMRPVMRLIHVAEGAARIHQLKTITARDF